MSAARLRALLRRACPEAGARPLYRPRASGAAAVLQDRDAIATASGLAAGGEEGAAPGYSLAAAPPSPVGAPGGQEAGPDFIAALLRQSYRVELPGSGDMRHGTEGWCCLETSFRVRQAGEEAGRGCMCSEAGCSRPAPIGQRSAQVVPPQGASWHQLPAAAPCGPSPTPAGAAPGHGRVWAIFPAPAESPAAAADLPGHPAPQPLHQARRRRLLASAGGTAAVGARLKEGGGRLGPSAAA
jgi:hypothetical protein